MPGSPEQGVQEKADRVAGRLITVSKYVDIVRVTGARFLTVRKEICKYEKGEG